MQQHGCRLLEFSIVQQSCDQDDKDRTGIMDERSGGRRQETHEGERDGDEIDAQRKADAQPDGMDCCVGESLKICLLYTSNP